MPRFSQRIGDEKLVVKYFREQSVITTWGLTQAA